MPGPDQIRPPLAWPAAPSGHPRPARTALDRLVASALAGGDCIDRTGGTAFSRARLRSFRWGHRSQLERVSRELLARAWLAGAGSGDGPLTRPGPPSARPWPRRAPATTCSEAGLPPAAGPSVSAARGPGQHRPRRRPLPAGDGGTGYPTETPGRQRVHTHGVVSVCRKMDVNHPPAQKPAQSHRYKSPIPYWIDPPMFQQADARLIPADPTGPLRHSYHGSSPTGTGRLTRTGG